MLEGSLDDAASKPAARVQAGNDLSCNLRPAQAKLKLKKASPEFYLHQYIEKNITQQITVKQAAEFIGRSTSFVIHQFKIKYVISFHEYVLNYRIQLAKNHLKTKSINETYELCGFKNRYHFCKVFTKKEGISPKTYQNKISFNKPGHALTVKEKIISV